MGISGFARDKFLKEPRRRERDSNYQPTLKTRKLLNFRSARYAGYSKNAVSRYVIGTRDRVVRKLWCSERVPNESNLDEEFARLQNGLQRDYERDDRGAILDIVEIRNDWVVIQTRFIERLLRTTLFLFPSICPDWVPSGRRCGGGHVNLGRIFLELVD